MEMQKIETLEQMHNVQKYFTELVEKEIQGIDINKLDYKKTCELVKDYALHCMRELTEVVNEFDFKRHRKPKHDKFNKEKVLDELVDVFKFWHVLLIITGYDIKSFINQWCKKTNIVADRFKKE